VTGGILVVRFSSLGDVVLITPVLEALKRRIPERRVVLLTRSDYAPIFAADGRLDALWAWDEAEESLTTLARRVRAARFDRIVDLHGSLRSRLVTLGVSSLTTRMDKQSLKRWALVARPPLKRRRALRPVTIRYLETAGLAGEDPTPRLELGGETLAAGRAWRQGLAGGGEGTVVALLPGARHPAKRWPLDRWVELAERLREDGIRPLVLPPPEGLPGPPVLDRPGFETVPPLIDPLDLAGALAAVDGVVANDSGPMHLAAAVGTPTVGLFGPTSPELGFAPVGPHTRALHLGLFCSPCSRHGRHPCWRSRRVCLEDLLPQAVLGALGDLGVKPRPVSEIP
jgi:heptosyltransferase-2